MWTEDNLRLLREMCEQGKSFGEISRTLGTTRSAVIGKAFRLGIKKAILPRSKDTPRPPPKAKPSKITLPVQFARPRPPEPKSPEPPRPEPPPEVIEPEVMPEQGVSIIELDNETCRWPIEDFRYCGVREANLAQKRPYCEKHHGMAWNEYRPAHLKAGK